MSERHVAIVGGGVIGLFCAWYARQSGFKVSIIERGAPGHDCCSLGNGGMIVPSHIEPLAAPGMATMALKSLFTPDSPVRVNPRMDLRFLRWGLDFLRSASPEHVRRAGPLLRDFSLLSRSCYLDLAETGRNDFAFVPSGMISLANTELGLEHECNAAEAAQRLGIEARVVTPPQLRQLEPTLHFHSVGAVHYPLDARLVPQRLVAFLSEELQAQGVQFLWNTEALGWRSANNRVEALRTSRGELFADEYVLAAGCWTPRTLLGLRLRLPVEAGKGYSITLPQPRRLPTHGAMLSEARIAVTPMGTALRFAGTMQFSGIDARIDTRRVRAMVKAIPEYLPDFQTADFAAVSAWAGLRPITPDGLPFLGRSARYENFVVASGHAMMGVSLAPATGLIVSELLTGRPTSLPLALLRPERFSAA